MKARWGKIGIVAAILLCKGTKAEVVRYEGFLRSGASTCRFESHSPGKPVELLRVDSDVCALVPQLVALYVKVKGRSYPCKSARTGQCLHLIDVEPAPFDPLASR